MTEFSGSAEQDLGAGKQGFAASLLDFSFKRFITLDILKVIYITLIVLITIGALVMLVTFFTQGFLMGVLGLIVTPLIWLLEVVLARVYLELIAVIFRIASHTGRLVEQRGA